MRVLISCSSVAVTRGTWSKSKKRCMRSFVKFSNIQTGVPFWPSPSLWLLSDLGHSNDWQALKSHQRCESERCHDSDGNTKLQMWIQRKEGKYSELIIVINASGSVDRLGEFCISYCAAANEVQSNYLENSTGNL